MASGPFSKMSVSPEVSKDAASKRKRVNKSSKLKQSKLEVRREQWLSKQGSSLKQSKETSQENPDSAVNDPGEVIHPVFKASTADMLSDKNHSKISKSCSKFRVKPSEKDGMYRRCAEFGSNDSGELSTSAKSCVDGDKSPKNKASKVGKVSGGDHKSSKHQDPKVVSFPDSSRKSNFKEGTHGSVSFYSGHEQHHRCVGDTYDGWEAAAEALCLNDSSAFSSDPSQLKATVKDTCRVPTSTGRAWMSDDIYRPACLPSLKKQESQPLFGSINHQQWFATDKSSINHQPWFATDKSTDEDSSVGPPQCPICTEDLDSTDSSFEPCSCGFSLCLFCYHRIVSEDGRCPGCRQAYNRDLSVKSPCTCT